MARDLNDWLHHITNLHPQTMDFGLDRIRQVAESAQLIPPAPINLVVAGSNGKGSTCAFAEALLMAQGYSVGTTLSPHINDYRERFRVNGNMASEVAVVAAFEHVDDARQEITLTYFEFSILVAFSVFKSAGVDVAVLEVGLGGRLDAVNLVDADVAVITSIGLEHQDYLGHDIEAIGAEKAGIVRAHKTLILGARNMPVSIFAKAGKVAANVVQLGVDFDYDDGDDWNYQSGSSATPAEDSDIEVTALGNSQLARDNVATAITAVAHLTTPPSREQILHALSVAHLPGRFQVHEVKGRILVVDLAHNPAAASFLNQQLNSRFAECHIVAVTGFLSDKDVSAIYCALANSVSQWLFVPTSGERGQTAEISLQKAVEKETVVSDKLGCHASVTEAIEKAVSMTGPSDVILVFGSFSVIQQVFSDGYLK